MSVRILVTGSRHWSDPRAVTRALREVIAERAGDGHRNFVVVHGACPAGADRFAAEFCDSAAKFFTPEGLHITEEAHPAEWAAHGRAAGPIRNQKMVDLGASVCLAFPLPSSRGTVHCMERARAAGIEVRVFEGALR